jgi:hypothetical protein
MLSTRGAAVELSTGDPACAETATIRAVATATSDAAQALLGDIEHEPRLAPDQGGLVAGHVGGSDVEHVTTGGQA